MRLSIQHVTRYRYTETLTRAVQQLYLWPTDGPTQVLDDWSVRAPALVQTNLDGLGNTTGHFTFDGNTHELQLSAVGTVNTVGLSEWLECAPELHPTSTSEAQHARDTTSAPSSWVHPAFYLRSGALSRVDARMTDWARAVLGASGDQPVPVSRDAVLQLTVAVSGKVAYNQGLTDVQTQALEAFDGGAGVCQDQAHTMLAMCRGLGWPARYVSGYLYAPNQPELASHAWVDVCVGFDAGAGRANWLSVDITQACVTTDQYVRLAVGTDYSTCAPSKGVRVGGGIESMSVDVAIAQV